MNTKLTVKWFKNKANLIFCSYRLQAILIYMYLQGE